MDLLFLFLILPAGQLPLGIAVVALGIFVLVFAVFLAIVAQRMVGPGRKEKTAEHDTLRPDNQNPTAFMTASMQAVIERLRGQEKELARLHRMEKERAQETERLSEAVTRNMPAGLLLVSSTGSISSANPAAEAILGVRGLAFRGYHEVLGQNSALAEMITSCLRVGNTFQRGEVEHTIPTGEVKRIGVTISPILRPARGYLQRSADGSPAPSGESVSGALCLMSDLTELFELQKQMRWKENLAALGEMSAGIAHEFKNALATISGYAQMIRSEANTDDLADSADRIIRQTQALTHVVTEFLRFSRPLELTEETVRLEALVEQVAEEICNVIPDRASIRPTGSFAEIAGDEGLLRQALLNLVRNAAEAVSSAGERGMVMIAGATEDRAGGLWQRITVSDNGPGIPPENLTKIFVPFYTTKAEGTGLGLALVQKIAVQHGGSVEARNRSEGGAEFILWLPLTLHPTPEAIASGAGRIYTK
jgi:two-component system sensor histidine kinase HydH